MSFLSSLPPHAPARERVIAEAIAAGRLDQPRWMPVDMGPLTVMVSADYLTIDGERVPMSASNATRACNKLGGLLPTVKIVEAIEAVAVIIPLPTWADRSTMLTSDVFDWCEHETDQRVAGRSMLTGSTPLLLAGHRKDVVLAKYMPAGMVVIFGARWPDGRRLQPLHPHGPGGSVPPHLSSYADYSHGVRCVHDVAHRVGGGESLVSEILRGGWGGWDALTDEGPLTTIRYPVAEIDTTSGYSQPRPDPSSDRLVLRRGDRGPLVLALQRRLTAAGIYTRADGAFGPLTEASVIALQRRHGLVEDGIVGRMTYAALDSEPPEEHDVTPASPLVYPLDVARALALPAPLSEAAVDRVFGTIAWSPVAGDDSAIRVPASWQAGHLVSVHVPQLVGIPGYHAHGTVTVNKLIAEPFRALWAAWEAHGLLPLVKHFGGSLAFRRVRGGSLVSRHARGLAFDINDSQNPRGGRGAPRGTPGSVCELLEDLPAHGFTTGGLYSTPDWMHAECCEIV